MTTIRKMQNISFQTLFKSWLISDYWDNNMPLEFSPNMRNIRLSNGSTIIRKGFLKEVDSSIGTTVKWLSANYKNDELLVVCNKKLKIVDLSAWTYTDVATPATISTTDKKVNIINYSNYTIILNWEDYPYIRDWTTLSQTTSSNIESWANPYVWAVFEQKTWVAGTGTKSNILYKSVAIWASTETNSYDWTNSGSEKLSLENPIIWLVWTLSDLYIFTNRTIEKLVQTELWWSIVYSTLPIWYSQLASSRSVVDSWDRLFFLTTDKKIQTINYVEWISQSYIWDLSDRNGRKINKFLEDNLDDNQSESFALLDQKNNLIKFYVKPKNDIANSLIIVYDLASDNFLIDDNKFFSFGINYNGNIYCGSILDSSLYQDEIWNIDNNIGIPWYRETKYIDFWQPMQRKIFKEIITSWKYNNLADINLEITVDDDIISDKDILEDLTTWTSISSGTIWWSSIWWTPIWWSLTTTLDPLYNFDIKTTSISNKWKRIKLRYYGNNTWSEIALDNASIGIIPIWDLQPNNKS